MGRRMPRSQISGRDGRMNAALDVMHIISFSRTMHPLKKSSPSWALRSSLISSMLSRIKTMEEVEEVVEEVAADNLTFNSLYYVSFSVYSSVLIAYP